MKNKESKKRNDELDDIVSVSDIKINYMVLNRYYIQVYVNYNYDACTH